VVVLALACLAVAPEREAPAAAVRRTLDRAERLARGEGTREQKLESLREIAGRLVDTRAMGRRALGTVLASRPPTEQEQFFALFDEFILRAYLQRLLLFRKPDFRIAGGHVDGDAALVETRIHTRKDAFAVDYPMRRRDGRWWAVDVVVEGVSLAENYGDQFRSVLRSRSFGELLELMRRKVRHYRRRDAS
jgi:phospholipid transport system substrate-binding protein